MSCWRAKIRFIMKINILTMLKTLLFTLQNGKNISSGMQILCKTAKSSKERKIYTKIYDDIKDGNSFSDALAKQKISSIDIIEFIAMAEKSVNFKSSLEKIVHYLEVKETFKRESSDKTSLPTIYFLIASIVVIAIKFFAVPMQIERSLQYSQEIVNLISNHLAIAQLLTDILFMSLIIFAGYFLILLIALFDKSYTIQYMAKKIALLLPFASIIVVKFEKFALFSMLSEMLSSGITYKNALESAINSTSVNKFKIAMIQTLTSIKRDGKFIFHSYLYDDMEKELLAGTGSSKQLGLVMNEISQRAKADAMELSTKFFRMITFISIFLMAFAVFIEFYTIVLTQIIIQKGMIDASKGVAF